MAFNSIEYLVFLPLVACAYFALPLWARRAFLLLASYTFYWFFSLKLSLLMAGSSVLSWATARWMGRSTSPGQRRAALLVCLGGNLGLLATYKYLGFFSHSLAAVLGVEPWPVLQLALPMGISFYVFQSLSHTIDVYRGEARGDESLLDFMLYIAFFPQLVAGPIMRGGDLLPQFAENHRPNLERMLSGALLCAWGLLKKVFVADPMGQLVNSVYGTAGQPVELTTYSGWALLLATYGFAVQIYCDFSAYSDMAVGSARILGFRLMRNFDAPYLATSLREFWRRWHISLSTWLRDYLYISLGGNRVSPWRVNVNLAATMLLGGLWHGASWTFVVWGGLHGAYLIGERWLGRRETFSLVGRRPKRPCPTLRCSSSSGVAGLSQPPLPPLRKGGSQMRVAERWQADAANSLLKVLGGVVTFHLVCLAWVFFRAQSVEQGVAIVGRILTAASGESLTLAPLACLIGMLLVQGAKRRLPLGERVLAHPHLARWGVYATLVLAVLALARSQPPQFIYFQF